MKRLETASFVAVILVACLGGFFLVKDHISPQLVSTSISAKLLSVKDIPLSKTRPTLVLAVSSQCHFCVESTPFYKRLTQIPLSSRQADLIAVMPQNGIVAKQFMDHEGLKFDRLASVDFSQLGVDGTPTVFLVGVNGTVLRSWTGKLTPVTEQQVINALNTAV